MSHSIGCMRSRVAVVDLTEGQVEYANTPPEIVRLYLGGRGLNVAYLHRMLAPGVDPLSPDNILIVGAGDAGAMILREMQNNPGLGLHAIGFVDDNRAKLQMRIRGVPVLGTREDIPALVKKHRINEVIIAMPTSPGGEIRAIKSICDQVGVRYKTVPGIFELIGGTVSVSQIREVQIEDLLRRESVAPNPGPRGR